MNTHWTNWAYRGLATVLVTVSACSVAPADGASSGGGGGLAEKNVVFAYENLERYVDLCLSLKSCRLTDTQRSDLTKIRDGIRREPSAAEALVFRNEGGFFQLDGAERVARTGGKSGDPIFVNRRQIYSGPDASPMALGPAVAMLVHELGHHQGIANHEALDLLGSKVEANLANFSVPVHGKLLNQRVELLLVYPGYDLQHPPGGDSFTVQGTTQIIVSDLSGIRDITKDVFSQVRCPSEPSSIVPTRSSGALSAQWMNVHFYGNTSGNPEEAILQGRFLGTCRRDDGTAYVSVMGSEMTVKFHLELPPGEGDARTERTVSQDYRLKSVEVWEPESLFAI